MKDYILKKLYDITEEEQIFSNNGDVLKQNIYSRASRFFVEMQLMSEAKICYGNKNAGICMKTHIRLADFPPHSHDYIEMMYVCQGNITNVIGNKEITLKQGDIIILGKDTVHSIKKTSIDDIGIVLMISYDVFSYICNDLRTKSLINEKSFSKLTALGSSVYSIFRTNGINEIENLIENIISPIVNASNKPTHLLQTEVHLLMSYLVGLPEIHNELFEGSSKTDKALRDFNLYIETKYMTASLTDASSLLGFTPTYLCRWVKHHYGITFKELLLEKRFEVAIDLILNSSLSINEIIQTVGYENNSYFYKEFQKRFGTTPKKLRNQV